MKRCQMMHNIDDLVSGFVSCALRKDDWTHAAHLTVGLWHVRQYGAAEALVRLREGISRLNESFGNVNTDTSGYHETITCAYVQLLAGFLDECPAEMAFEEKVDSLVRGPLADKHVLLRFYTSDTLSSSRARLVWVEPDLSPLSAASLLNLPEGRSAV